MPKATLPSLKRQLQRLQNQLQESTATISALRQSEQRLQKIFTNVASGIAITDWSGYFLECNEAYCALVGYTLTELRAMHFTALIHPVDLAHHLGLVEAVKEGRQPSFTSENRYLRKNGDTVWVRKFGSTLTDDQEQPVALIILATNISEQRAEAESHLTILRQAESLADLGGFTWDILQDRWAMTDNWCRIHGCDTSHLTTEELRSLAHPDDLPAIMQALAAVREHGQSYNLVHRIIRKGDGQVRHVRVRGSVQFAADGSPQRLFGAVSDITRELFIREQLKQQEQRFKSYFTSNPSATFVWRHDDQGYVLEAVNQAALNITGGGAQRFLGKTAQELYPDLPEMVARFDECRLSGKIISFLSHYKNRNVGNYDWVYFRIARIDPSTILLYADIVTEQKTAEDKLAFQAQLLDSVGQAVIATDLDSTIIYWNEEAQQLYGYADTEALGRDLNALLSTAEEEEQVAALSQTRNTDAVWHGECTCKHRSGRLIPVQISTKPFQDQEGNTQGIISITMDISERKNLEKKYRQAQKMEAIGNLAGGIAHDFNNILSSIIGFTELALLDASPGSEQEDNLGEVYQAGLRAKEVINQILAFARQSSDTLEPLEPGEIVREVSRLIRATTPVNIAVHTIVESEARVLGNAGQLHQIILNLCTNAIHAMSPSGGTLTIELKEVSAVNPPAEETTEVPTTNLELTVRDTGTGIPEEIMPRIFEPYFTTKRRGEGTGMGLATCKGIIESMHGAIRVDSAPSQGTAFTIRLPILLGGDEMVPDGEYPIPRGSERIIIVDDELPIVRLSENILRGLGYTVTAVNDGSSVLQLLASHPDSCDLVISDMTMPGMNGIELCKALRAIRDDLPVIICTGFSKEMSKERAEEEGIDALLYKPLTRRELATTVRQVLDSRKDSNPRC